MNKLFLYGLMAAIALSLGLLISCGSSSSSSSDDDTAGDDDTTYSCTQAYDDMYTTCSLAFKDGSGNDIPVDTVVTACEASQSPYGLTEACGMCVVNNYNDCNAMNTCLESCVSGADDDTSPAS